VEDSLNKRKSLNPEVKGIEGNNLALSSSEVQTILDLRRIQDGTRRNLVGIIRELAK